MKKLGLGLFLIAFLAMMGSVIWTMVDEAEQTPWVVILITAAFFLGGLALLGQAIIDRQKQKKQEDFEEVDN